MRCSICLSEMKQGPYGLECVACGTMLEPVEDETGTIAKPQSKLYWRLGIFAGLMVIIALIIWAILAFAPGRTSTPQSDFVSQDPLRLQQIVLEDEHGIIAQARSFSRDGATHNLMSEKGCQSLPSEGVETVQWVNVAGDPLSAIRPSFPGNWRLHQVCPTETGGALFATLLDAGVAISHVEPSGQTRWTQLVTVSNPTQTSVNMRVEAQFILLISHDETEGELQIEAFDQDGDKSWRQSIGAGPSIESLRSGRTSFGDVLIAWREPAIGLRLVILSPLGGVLQQGVLGDRTLPMHDVVQDELGQTFILYGENQTVVELISRTSDSVWQRTLDSAAQSVGALSYDASFFVFTASDDQLKIWGLDQFGAVSEVLTVRLIDQIVAGDVRPLNAVEAVLTLQLEDADPVDLVLDLRRLENALSFELTDPVQDFGFARGIEVEMELEPVEPQVTDTRRASERLEAIANEPDDTPDIGLAEPEAAVESVTVLAPEQPTAESGLPASTVAADQPSDSQEPTPSTMRPVSTQVSTPPSQARCTFSCVSIDGSEIEYVLMQTVEVNDGESLTDVSLRLNETHENLCGVSGGEPASEYTRECGPG